MSDLPAVVQSLTQAGVPTAGAMVAYKVFGKSLTAFGSNLGEWTDRWSKNLLRIADRAETKLGERAQQPGDVSPRVVQKVLSDGVWCDDPVSQDYYAGIVAASRSENGIDDSSVPYVQMLTRLSSRDIRAHHVLYRFIRGPLSGGWRLGDSRGRRAAKIYVPLTAFAAGMGSNTDEAFSVTARVVATLGREALIEDEPWHIGKPDDLKKAAREREWRPPEAGLVVTPSWVGIDLAIRVDGNPSILPTDFLYLVNWNEPEGVAVDDSCVEFPSAPTTFEDLEKLRQDVGHLHVPPETWGRAVPRPTVE